VTKQLPSLAGADWLRARPTQTVLASIRRGGHGARVVGGAVRNALLGRPVADIDIATTATPEQVVELAHASGLKTIATGLQHGTVTVVADGHPFEVTTLRHDLETYGRHAKVAFTDDWHADASRRDLTLNALYCEADGTIFDPLNGIGDLLARRVRFIGDARQRIREDYLRILRFFRFTAEYSSGPPDAEGIAAAVAERQGLAGLSSERVRAELVRLLAAPGAVPVCRAMAGHGLLTAIVPVAPRLETFARLAAIERASANAPDAALRLAALAVAVADDVPRLAQHLRLSGAERAVLARAGAPIELRPEDGERMHRAVLYRLGPVAYHQQAMLAWARSTAAADDGAWRRLAELPARWPVPVMPYSGRDVVERGVPPGPRVGACLAAFEAWWIAEDFPSDPVVLDAALARFLKAA
jgi:poly(A) polymerase